VKWSSIKFAFVSKTDGVEDNTYKRNAAEGVQNHCGVGLDKVVKKPSCLAK
jgi:hypothetical protein